jgi:hypothetical protein
VTTVSIWEDPAYFYRLPEAQECCLKPWSPLDSPAAFRHQLGLIKLNLGRTLFVFLNYSPMSYAVGIGALVFCIAPFWGTRRRDQKVADESDDSWFAKCLVKLRDALSDNHRLITALALATILIYPIPYTLVFSDERFFWPVLIVVLGLGFHLLNLAFNKWALSRNVRVVLVGLFALSFIQFPVRVLASDHHARDATTSFARQLEGSPMAGSRFASNNDYGAAVCVGYHIKAKYYGQAAPGMSDEAIAEDLKRKGVQYYFVWDRPGAARPGMKLVRYLEAEYRRLAIYEVDSIAQTGA